MSTSTISDGTSTRRLRGSMLLVLAVITIAGLLGFARPQVADAATKAIGGCKFTPTVASTSSGVRARLDKNACTKHPTYSVKLTLKATTGYRSSRTFTFGPTRRRAQFVAKACNPDAKYQAVAVFSRNGTAITSVTSGSPKTLCAKPYRLPLPKSSVQRAWLTKPHHTYPAADIPVPIGTAFYAITGGTVRHVGGDCGLGYELLGNDGVSYKYCHANHRRIANGARVSAGQNLGTTGNTGRSTGPHLHLEIRYGGSLRCPQSMLAALFDGTTPPNPRGLPTSGCTY